MLLKRRQRTSQHDQDGYVLLTLLLTIAVMIIFTAAIMPSIAFEIKRDREQEMIHRGVQYSRAIRLYYLKFGRYPTKLEDLENKGNIRFLRRRYKDPVTGQDFNLLHFSDLRLPMAGAGIPGANPIGNSGVAGSSGLQNEESSDRGSAPASSFGNTSSVGTSPVSSQDSQVADQPQNSGSSPDTQSNDHGSASGRANPNDQLGPIIGGSIVGVVSASKAVGIREFDHKRKHNEWQFAFDPTAGVGLPTSPNQHPWKLLPQPLSASSTGTMGRVSSGDPQNAGGPSNPNE